MMAKLAHLHQLFDAHTKDLNDLPIVDLEEIFICPICFTEFSRKAIDQKLVNDGHVWPKEIRKKSKKAGHMQVLLCKECNEGSSRADNQMQIYEKVKQGDETGALYGVRLVEFREEGNDKPIQIRVNVRINKDGSHTITGRLGKNMLFKDSTPEDKERFDYIFREKKKVSLTIHPPQDYIPEIVSNAWITSSYLMAFYALGYRYIVRSNTQVVRDYILSSFDKTDKELPVPNEETFSLQKYVGEYYPDPVISFIYPLESGKKVYLLVSFLSYAVRFPILFEPSVMNIIMGALESRLGDDFKKLLETGLPLKFNIPCTKTKVHECMFDYIMGKKLSS